MMNLPKLGDIEEEVINFLQRTRNKAAEINHESSINESNETINYQNQLQGENFLSHSNISQFESNKESIKQKNTNKIDYFSSDLGNSNVIQNMNNNNSNHWANGTDLENAIGTPSSSDYSNFNQNQDIFNLSNYETEYNYSNNNNLNNRNNLIWNLLDGSNIFDETYIYSQSNQMNNHPVAKEYLPNDEKYDLKDERRFESPLHKSKYMCSNNVSTLNKNAHQYYKDKSAFPEMSTYSNCITDESESVSSIESNEITLKKHLNYGLSEDNDKTSAVYYKRANRFKRSNSSYSSSKSSKSKSEDDKDSSSIPSNFSDKESDVIEEIIIREKLNRLNDPSLENSFNGVANDIIYESNSTVQDKIKQRNDLLILADKLAEAIEYNISMRNYLYDLEHTLLRLVEGSKSDSAIKVTKKNAKSYKKRKFYYKFQAPYFKDKRGISCAPYVDESIRSENEKDCIEDYMRICRLSQQPEIYEIYNAIKRYFIESNGLKTVENNEKGNKKRGRKKIIFDSEYSENDLYSMESHFVNFLSTYNRLDLQLYFDKQIDWFKVASMPNLQGITAKECYNMWTMVLKPLLELGSWSDKESEQVLKIAQTYNYQRWDEIAKELGTGRSGYLSFCHVMSKPIRGVTQNTGAWTKEEDDFLLTLIEKCSYGNSIMWGRIFYYFEDRTVTQVLNRWYRLNPALKRGKFNHNEDIMLMYCIEQFGRDFGKIATLFGNRSPIQLRERYFAIKDLIDENKLGEWSVEEDRLLLNLVEEYGESKWAEIAAEFPGRNRTQIRHRYTSVLKRWIATPSFQLESLKRHKRTTHIKSVNRVKQIDTSESDVRIFVENKLKTGKATLKRDKRAGKHPTLNVKT